MVASPAGNSLSTRQHFEILDGLRGVAAIAVVIFHFMEFATPDYEDNFIAHAYLAVDFFFCLSGFVIAYAYDNKIAQIGVAQFFRLRLIRLHPLVVIGSLIGIIAFVFDPWSDLFSKYADKTLLMLIASCLLIPFPLVKERYFNLFHLNPPTWSLFWEYVANIFYAYILCKVNKKVLWVLTVIAAGALLYESYQSGYVGVGWSGDNISGGGIRVAFSFLAGMLVYRSNFIIKSSLGFAALSILLLLSFLIPFDKDTSWLTDVLVVVFYFPLLVALGAGAGLHARFSRLCKFSGAISYPLYMVHYPFLWLFGSYMEVYKPSMQVVAVLIPTGVVLMVALSYVVMVYVDAPIRKYFTNRLKKKVLVAKN